MNDNSGKVFVILIPFIALGLGLVCKWLIDFITWL